jgi:DNA-directed RNA polymerase specialized sigma24 family protein
MKTETVRDRVHPFADDEFARYQLPDLAMRAARKAGKQFRLQSHDEDDLCSRLYLRLWKNRHKYNLEKGLPDAWAYGHAKWIVVELRREAHRLDQWTLMEIAENVDRPWHGLCDDDSFDREIWKIDPNADVAGQLESLRPRWLQEFRQRIASAFELAREGYMEDAKREMQHAALLDTLIGIPVEELAPLWKVLMLDQDRVYVASQHGVTRNTIDQRIGRFRKDISSRYQELAFDLAQTAYPDSIAKRRKSRTRIPGTRKW